MVLVRCAGLPAESVKLLEAAQPVFFRKEQADVLKQRAGGRRSTLYYLQRWILQAAGALYLLRKKSNDAGLHGASEGQQTGGKQRKRSGDPGFSKKDGAEKGDGTGSEPYHSFPAGNVRMPGSPYVSGRGGGIKQCRKDEGYGSCYGIGASRCGCGGRRVFSRRRR